MSEQWFDAAKRPARPGVYQVLVPSLDRRTWARWTGSHWTCWAVSVRQAEQCQWAGIRDGYYWRMVE